VSRSEVEACLTRKEPEMDPNIALDKLRELCREHITDETDIGLFRTEDRALSICEQFEALDQWLSNGGLLPSEWHRETDKLRGAP